MKTKEDVIRLIKEKNVRFLRIWFVDIHGMVKSFSIPSDEINRGFDEGIGFDGSSIQGFSRIDESDMIAKPDPATFQIIPWRPHEHTVARMFADIYKPNGEHYEGDPRYVLKRNLQKIKENGYRMFVGPEAEFFYFKDDRSTETLDEGGYFDLTTLDSASDLRRDTILTLEEMGIKVEYSHHEVAPSQHEIDLRYNDALVMGDFISTYRVIVKEIATKYGLYATFMPKPIQGVNGSGMHVHQSLFKQDRNAFFDKDAEFNLSNMARYYIAGIMKHAPEITIITNQWVNSYKRLVPGYEAPVYIAWARRNRSALIRVPMYAPGKEKATRLEYRSPDPACNPYLAFAVMLAAGMKGIENKYPLPAPIEEDIFEMSDTQRKRKGIKMLPGSLGEAISIAEKSSLLKETLGEHIFNKLIQSKKVEWDKYRIQVHQYEIDNYLPRL